MEEQRDKDQEPAVGSVTPDDGEDQEVFTLPEAPDADQTPEDQGDRSVDLTDWDAMAFNPANLDEYSSDHYVGSTTQEYQVLAEEVNRAAGEQWELQAVSATVPGVDSGLVGFEDVTGGSRQDKDLEVEAHEQAATSDVAMRFGSAVVIFGMFLGSLLLGGWWFTGFLILVMVVGAGEFYATIRAGEVRPLALFGLLGVVFMGLGARLSGVAAIGGWAAGFGVVTVLFLSLSPRRQPLEDAAVTIGGMAWVGLLSFAVLIADGPHSVAYILFLVLVVASNDIGAFFIGRSLGRRPLAKRLSPHKTVEGFVGGLIASLVVASILITFPAWEGIGIARGLVTAALVGLVSPMGDAVESMVKRSLGVKDMGSVMPGHGGILDRTDSFLLAVPLVYFLFRGFGLL